ncbi:MAG: toxin-antitoxin system YwqK family antitoxin [Bacteroidetes bacterium]|nr:toxin-antitoxin system YwqK family antitoxin [Bacteroidota bacterium]
MNKAILLLLFILSSVVLFGQSSSLNQIDKNGKKQGHWIKKDEHDRPIYEGDFKDNKPIGEFKYYYDTGELKTISDFSKDGFVCRTRHYFPGNILMAEGKYVNEKRDSVWKFYNAPNALVSEESYKNGKKDGVEKNYSPQGKLVEEKNWKDSILNGTWKQYYEDGGIKTEGAYNAGFLEGEIKYYYPGKIISTVGHYQHSLKHGKWIYYDRRGLVVIGRENYSLEKLEGEFGEWYEKDGKPKVKGKYLNGMEEGKWEYWDENGNIQKEANYSFGRLHGYYLEYYEDAKKKAEGNYYYDNKTGKWMEWDEEGKVTLDKTFDSVDVLKKHMLERSKEQQKKEKK